MSKRIAIASAMVLAFGCVSIPGGFVIDNVIDDLVFNNIDFALQEMRARAGPMVEPMVNATITAKYIFTLLDTTPVSPDMFFNDQSILSGIAWYINQTYGYGDLNFTSTAIERILNGSDPLSIPGWITDQDRGSGVLDFLDLYEAADLNLATRNQMIEDYNCTWDHLGYMVDYYQNYAIPSIPSLIESGTVASKEPELTGLNTTLEIADFYFLVQWCNGSKYPQGYPLPLRAGAIYGYEIGYQSRTVPIIPTNMSRESMYWLWNETNPYSLMTDAGLSHWWNLGEKHSEHYNATRDANHLNDSDEIVDMIAAWLPRFHTDLMPYLAMEAYTFLPTDTTTLGNLLVMGGIVMGVSFIGLAGVGFASNIRIKRKRLTSG